MSLLKDLKEQIKQVQQPYSFTFEHLAAAFLKLFVHCNYNAAKAA